MILFSLYVNLILIVDHYKERQRYKDKERGREGQNCRDKEGEREIYNNN